MDNKIEECNIICSICRAKLKPTKKATTYKCTECGAIEKFTMKELQQAENFEKKLFQFMDDYNDDLKKDILDGKDFELI